MVCDSGLLQRVSLFAYFIIVILVGAILLVLPCSWDGEGSVNFLDALFTSTSACCVTGLTTLDTTQWSLFGQIVIMFLIQLGGLGIIAWTSLLFMMRKRGVSFVSQNLVKNYTIDSIESQTRRILATIIGVTFVIEISGAILLTFLLPPLEGQSPIFVGLFHAVSAFCNAGFSLYPNGLESHYEAIGALLVIMGLIITGGLGFIVYRDFYRRIRKTRKRLTVHTVLVLITTACLIIFPAISFFFFERHNTMKDFNLSQQLVNSLFQAVSPRTAGFSTVPQGELSPFSYVLTIFLMFIGGGSGSMAGGIKVTTFAIIVLSIFKGLNRENNINIHKREIDAEVVTNAYMFAMKALFLVGFSVLVLSFTENYSVDLILFEVVSAFGTVGLSAGITTGLTWAGKIVLIFVMFAGRVGLVSMAFSLYHPKIEKSIKYPKAEVMIG